MATSDMNPDSFFPINPLDPPPPVISPSKGKTREEPNKETPKNPLDDERATIIRLNPPKPFSGKREDLKKFLQKVIVYLLVNEKLYDTDMKRITFALSFMTEGEADSWQEEFIQNALSQDPPNFGTWDQFAEELQKAFSPYDSQGDALEEIKALKMGNNSIEDHVARFKILINKSGLDKKSPAVADYFRETLGIPLQKRLLSLENPPVSLDQWYEKATKTENAYQRIQRIIGRSADRGKAAHQKKEEPKKRTWSFSPRKDPNAMDVDAMSVERREEMMKKGLCFGCGEAGHLNRDCPKKTNRRPPPPTNRPPTQPPTYASTWTPAASTSAAPKKMAPKELNKYIRSLTAMMDAEEKEQFLKEAEEEGF